MKMFRKGRKGLGQTTVEYAIIIALVAMAAIGVYMALGGQMQNLVRAETEKLAGEEDVTVDRADTHDIRGPSLGEF